MDLSKEECSCWRLL